VRLVRVSPDENRIGVLQEFQVEDFSHIRQHRRQIGPPERQDGRARPLAQETQGRRPGASKLDLDMLDEFCLVLVERGLGEYPKGIISVTYHQTGLHEFELFDSADRSQDANAGRVWVRTIGGPGLEWIASTWSKHNFCGNDADV